MNESIILNHPEQVVYVVLDMSRQNFVDVNSVDNIYVFYTKEDAEYYIYQSRNKSKLILRTGQLNPTGNLSYLN